MVMSTELEIQVNGQWTKMNVIDALAKGERKGHCIECHKDVRAQAEAKNGAAAHVYHLSRNKKCPLSDTKDSKRLRKLIQP
jgi:hypothetical protein